MSADHPYQSSASGSPGGGSSPTTAKDQARQAAGTAADQGRHVAGVAGEEAQKVASEARSQVSNLVSEATSQVAEQSRTQRDRIVDTLRTFGDDLEEMATRGNGGMAANLAHEGSSRARTLASRLDGREPRDLLEDVRSFARRKPGTFLLGALAAGVVAGRVTRGAKSGASADTDRPEVGTEVPTGVERAEPVGHGTAAGTPLAGTGAPVSDPVYPAGADRPMEPATTGLPNPASSVSKNTTWSDTRAPGGRS
jgi:gas vesicle protein